MPARRPSTVTDLALIAVFAGLTAAFTLAPAIPLGAVGVPLTLQTLAVSLAALTLGGWRGGAAVALYVLVGLAGLPVFAGGSGGLGVLARPSVGYLVAFPLAALLLGFAAQAILRRSPARGWKVAASLLGAALLVRLLVIWPLGALGIMVNARIPITAALAADLPFWPGDLLKNLVAVLIALAVHRAFPTLLARPVAPRERAATPR